MLIYLHGLNSSSGSVKAGVLRKELAPSQVLAPSYPAHDPDRAIAGLSEFLRRQPEESPPVIIGSSMGGFYGQYLARRFTFAHLFMINPALEPWNLLRDHLGERMTTADGETYGITQTLIDSTRKYGITTPCDGVETSLFLDRGDEVIDYRVAASRYRDCARLMVFDGGDHGFQHMDSLIDALRRQLARHP